MAGQAGELSEHAFGRDKVCDPPSLGGFRRRWEAMAGQAGAPGKVEDRPSLESFGPASKVCGMGWNGQNLIFRYVGELADNVTYKFKENFWPESRFI